MLDGHVEVPHLTDAEEDRYSSLFKDVDVGTAWRSCVIEDAGSNSPWRSLCKSELGLGRDVLIGDEVLCGFGGLSKTLDCMPAAQAVLEIADVEQLFCCLRPVRTVEMMGTVPCRQYANMDDWRMDCLWWIVLLYNPVSGLQKVPLSRNHEYFYGTEGP